MYQGIEINEVKLLLFSLLFTVIFIALAGLTIVLFYYLRRGGNSKLKERMVRLRERAESDAYAKNELVKLERKHGKKLKRELYSGVALCAVSLTLSLIILFGFMLPGWCDYVKKDYVLYSGRLEVEHNRQHRNIILEDGTVVSGDLGYDSGIHRGKIVYSKRTEIALGRWK